MVIERATSNSDLFAILSILTVSGGTYTRKMNFLGLVSNILVEVVSDYSINGNVQDIIVIFNSSSQIVTDSTIS